MAKLPVPEKINSSKKLNELRSQVLAAVDLVRTGRKELEELTQQIEEFKELDGKIEEAKRTMYSLLVDSLRKGEAANVLQLEAAVQKELDEFEAANKKKAPPK